MNAQEPAAAEQVYQRMKDMQVTLRRGWTADGNQALFKLHPEPGSNRIGDQMAANHLGRILEKAPHLKEILPEHHQQLQASMPLTPNFTTFRIMLAYHSAVSGDIDRMTVLIKEMFEDFDIPLFPVVFQLLFKGFAIHRPKDGPSSKWSKERLHMTWSACRKAIRDSHAIHMGHDFVASPFLPSIKDLKTAMADASEHPSMTDSSNESMSKERKLSLWEELVIDLAAFPRERLKRIKRFHSTHFDDEISAEKHHSPFFQEAHYSAPQPDLDEEEGEYTLPNPVSSSLVDPNHPKSNQFVDHEFDVHGEEDEPPAHPQATMEHSSFSSIEKLNSRKHVDFRLKATKPLVCWLLRAYARVTGSRAQVEEIWANVRKIWVPKNDVEAEVVVKVLMRCLRDCDRTNGHG